MTETEIEATATEVDTLETPDGLTVVDADFGVGGDYPDDTVLVAADEPVDIEVGRVFVEMDEETGQQIEGTGEAVTHTFTHFIVSSLSDTIEGEQAQMAQMMMGLEADEDGVITLDESAVFASNAEGADGPQIDQIDGGTLQDAMDALAERL